MKPTKLMKKIREVICSYYRFRSQPDFFHKICDIIEQEFETPIVKFQKLYDDVEIPKYQTFGSAGMDVRVRIRNKIYINAGQTMVFRTGFKMAVPEGYEAQIRSRSGMAVKGICVANSPGTIDSDYRGEIRVALINHNYNGQWVKNGDRVAQMIIKKIPQIKTKIVDKLDETERNEGGFGSTGEK